MSKKLTLDESMRAKHGNVTVTIEADELEIEVDPAELGRAPAQAIARGIGVGIRSVSAQANPGTIRKRRAQGISSTTRWNATGRLASSIEAQQQADGSYAIVAAGDRLQAPELLERLAEDVPQLDGDLPELDAAIERTLDDMMTVRR